MAMFVCFVCARAGSGQVVASRVGTNLYELTVRAVPSSYEVARTCPNLFSSTIFLQLLAKRVWLMLTTVIVKNRLVGTMIVRINGDSGDN